MVRVTLGIHYICLYHILDHVVYFAQVILYIFSHEPVLFLWHLYL